MNQKSGGKEQGILLEMRPAGHYDLMEEEHDMASAIGIRQADGSVAAVQVADEGQPWRLSLTPAHPGQKKFNLVFTTLPGGSRRKAKKIGRYSFSRHDLDIPESAPLRLLLLRQGKQLVLGKPGADRRFLPLTAFPAAGRSTAGAVFLAAAGVVYGALLCALALLLLSRTIAGFDLTALVRSLFKF